MITQTYKLDIVPNGIKQVVDIHESDAGIRQITFQLYSSQGTSITLPVGAVAYVEGKKFSGAAYSYSATLSGTNVTFTVTPQMAAEEGGHDAQIKIMKDEDIICAANFTFWVQRDVLDGAELSDTEVPGLVTQMETMVDAAEGYAEQAAASASSMTPIDDELDEDSTNPVQNKVITEAFESGVFEGMTVGNAEQLVTSQKVEDSVPYVFRTTGGSADVGNRETDEIVGGSVVWGQLVNSGDTSVTVQSGHKYYSVINGTKTIGASNGTAISINDSSEDNVFDLTQMFGSTIADYLYTLESGTAGAGVAKLREWGWFTKAYYPYSANKIESVNVSTHVLTGFNQWDEEWELGVYSTSDGSAVTNNNRIRSKNRIHIIPNTTYYCKSGTTGITINLCFYDGSGAFISSMTGKQNATFTTPSNAYYMNFNTASVNLSTYNNDICINLHHSGRRDGEYEPYVKREYPLDSSITLRGIWKLDANNNAYCDGDIYKDDGSVERRYGIVDLGSLTWGAASAAGTSACANPPSDLEFIITKPIGVCDGLIPTSYANRQNYDGTIFCPTSSALYVLKSSFGNMTSAQVKAALSGVYLVYEKNASTTESATGFQNPQICDDCGTEEYVDASYVGGTRDFQMPTGHNTEYPTNMVDKLNHLPSAASANGDYIIRQNNMQMSLIPNPLPDAPTTDGTYVLKCTVSGGSASYSWVSE